MDFLRFTLLVGLMSMNVAASEIANIISNDIIADENQNEAIKVLDPLLKNIKLEENYENFLIIKCTRNESYRNRCPFEDSVFTINFPRIILDMNSTDRYKYIDKFSKEVIILICANHVDNAIKIFKSTILIDLNILRFIVYVEGADIDSRPDMLKSSCNQFFNVDIYNVVIILDDFSVTHVYYKCQKYPPTDYSFRIRLHNDSARIFENQFLDMYGDIIRTFPDQHPPRSMFHLDKNGKLRMLGYVGKLVETFAERRNATLMYPLPIKWGKIMIYEELRALIDENILDVATGSLTSPFHVLEKGMSYPYEILAYCFMIPVPQRLPFSQVYFIIVRPDILIMIFMVIIIYGVLILHSLQKNYNNFSLRDIFVNDKSIRGMLGQPFSMPANLNVKTKFICFQLGYASLVINTMYQAYLHSYFTQPPREKLVTSPDDIEAAGKEILLPGSDADFLKNYTPSVLQTHPHIIKIIENTDTFNSVRDSFNTHYVYPVNSARWRAYQEEQAYFHEQIFFVSEKFCVFKYMHFGLPMRVTLPYRDLINEYILRAESAGLLQLWMSQNFFDMVLLKLSSFQDLSEPDDSDIQLETKDLKWIMYLYLACMTASVLAFVIELLC